MMGINKLMGNVYKKVYKVKKSIIILEPIETVYRYNSSEGYILMKLDNTERSNKVIEIYSIKMMN